MTHPKLLALLLTFCPTAFAQDGKGLAKQILASPRIELATVHVSGMIDQATARHNITDTANGLPAKRSAYGNAPGGTVALSPAMLQGMLALAKTYSFQVTEIAGGSHSKNSRHYAGIALDVGIINGKRVDKNHADMREFMKRARALGATEVLGPGDAGHDHHVHVAWPRMK